MMWRAIAGIGGLLFFTMQADAQTIQGRIIAAADGRLLPQAHVAVLPGTRDSVIARHLSTNGLFAIDLPAAGEYRLRVELLGYTTLTTAPVRLPARTVISVDVRMREDAIALEPLRVVAERVEPPFMHDVRFRHRMAIGRLIAREQLDERVGSRLEDVLRDAGLQVSYVPPNDSSRRLVPLISGRQNSVRECFMSILVNGRREFPILDMEPEGWEESLERLWEVFHFRPQDVEAVEIFRGPAQVPAEFSDITSECGVVAFWLRDGYRSVEESGPYLGPLPRVALNVSAAGGDIQGKHAPGRGTAVEVAGRWNVVAGVSIGVRLRHGRHDIPADTLHAMMRLAAAERLGLFTAGIGPRIVVLRQSRVRPVFAARVQLARRSFQLPYDYVEGEANFVSWGWGWGGSAGAEIALTQRTSIEIGATRERLHFGEYRGLETPRRHTATDWTVTSLHFGLATRL